MILRLLLVLAASLAQAGEIAPADRRSDSELMTPELRAMQDDENANPGMLAVLDGEALWSAGARPCASCHAAGMTGVAARYPAIDAGLGRPVDLEMRINLCRIRHQGLSALPYESRELLALSAYVAHQSKGLPIAVADNAATHRFIAAGRTLFTRRQGQLNLSCARCHDDNWGKSLAGATVPQAQPTGYPVYRLEWQSLGSLQRRLRACLAGMRAEPYPYGAPEYATLELFLAWRARGLLVETPAVRP
jgi:sulfur-oxidizing protein SoxA